MLLEIFHERCAVGAEVSVVTGVAFGLFVDIACSIFKVFGPELPAIA